MLYEWFSLYIRDQMHYSSSRTTISRLFYMHLNMEFPADFNFVQAENYLFEKVEYPSLLKLKENLINNL